MIILMKEQNDMNGIYTDMVKTHLKDKNVTFFQHRTLLNKYGCIVSSNDGTSDEYALVLIVETKEIVTKSELWNSFKSGFNKLRNELHLETHVWRKLEENEFGQGEAGGVRKCVAHHLDLYLRDNTKDIYEFNKQENL